MPEHHTANAMLDERNADLKIRAATFNDLSSITDLHARAFGPGRFARTAYRVREDTPEISEYCRVAVDGNKLVGAVRMTNVLIGNKPGALLLGPLAVEPSLSKTGLGGQLISNALQAAKSGKVELVVLVGDEPYYGKQGFAPVPPGSIIFPGPVDPTRILAVQLKPNSLQKFQGPLVAQTNK